MSQGTFTFYKYVYLFTQFRWCYSRPIKSLQVSAQFLLNDAPADPYIMSPPLELALWHNNHRSHKGDSAIFGRHHQSWLTNAISGRKGPN